ncbi:PD-(D/E)XK motif protein [Paenarthrobacter aromaticivorans]|uniref:PD-(D/E)XK motif protein n=1 Tax=Paenarthrobacter aromaticivorans TaxID=2849150 RepID=A0ABS6I4F8_9MICC|nr:PD-(D/E)XK motif protein [Paenarthrobacter sp. MMS21-TAE1-1]MBU8866625.1 PD-(D/E)XK motif protein [Paenarthrobacter sp. MMS21-TAE1-1]
MRETSGSVFDYLAKDVSTSGRFHSRKSGVVAANGDVLHAVDTSGHPTVLVPLGETKDGPLAWQSKSLQLQTLELAAEETQTPFVVLRCLDSNLNHQFGLLVDDILDAIELEPDRAANAVSVSLHRWRNLFEVAVDAILGTTQLSGLLAELIFLGELVAIHGPTAITAWKGPEGSRHDFVFKDCSVEVKATTNHNNLVVTIHGGRQLSLLESGNLYLRAFQLEPSPNGISVPEKIEHLIAAGISRIALFTALRNIHYYDADSTAYEKIRFLVLSEKSYLVNEDFPRIAPETLVPAGIIDRLSNISYSLDLGQLEHIDHDVSTVALASTGAP